LAKQSQLQFSAIRNADFLSNHWLDKRLADQPEWENLRSAANDALTQMAALWEKQKDLAPKYDDEAGLEQAFIQPILGILGWELKYQAFLQGREPDYALFLNAEDHANAINAGRKSSDFWKFPKIVADAKAWHVSLDRPTTTGSQREFPPQQIEWYLNYSNLDYAILTNGHLWRLIPRKRDPHQPRFQTYLECNLKQILERHAANHLDFANMDDFLRFFLFFSPHAYRSVPNADPLIARAIAGSSAYRLSASEGLKERVYHALELSIEGFLNHGPNNLSPTTDLPAARANAFTLLYRLLFIFFAEDRQLLPFRKNDLYTKNRALSRFRDDIATHIDQIKLGQQIEFSKTDTDYWKDISALFALIDEGKHSYGVPAYNGGLFNSADHPFLQNNAIPDYYLARVIDALGRAVDPEHPDTPPFPVDYKDLAIQDLGNIYEGLLELHPHYATQPVRLARARRASSGQRPEEKYLMLNETLSAGFSVIQEFPQHSVYLATDKGERRASGSYYTPDHIVSYIVEKTLGPLCSDINQKLCEEIASEENAHKNSRGAVRDAHNSKLIQLRADFDDRILALRVLDPAMGSGHFLIRACQFLAEEIATNPHAAAPDTTELKDDESTIIYWKRKVVENCLYGVDLNPVAVELAKLALWLETVSTTQPLSFLDHHLRHGNSLVGASVDQLGTLPGELALIQNTFQNQVAQKLPILLGFLQQIRSLPSDTVSQVKDKEQIFLKTVESERTPFRQIADIWIATFFSPTPHISPADYAALIDSLGKPKTFTTVRDSTSLQSALAVIRPVAPFHWELEFPDVFFDNKGRLTNPGFHAIIGNPPYDVLSEKENKIDLSAFRSYIQSQPRFAPSIRGKNDLYKLFVCQALHLLANNGRLGLITPMTILGADITRDVRTEMLAHGAFTFIDAFPQKDNPSRRVFPEAKLSTVVWGLIKSDNIHVRAAEFVSRIHAANTIDVTSPSLRLTADQIPAYDPDNLTIVSCSQADWDLATAIMSSGRLTRLGKVATQFQGELNQTNDIPRGNLSFDASHGPEVIRGAHLCLYAVREASQGDPVFVQVADFTAGATGDVKATHHRYARVGFQRKSPQNNFRRLIAGLIAPQTFLLESVSYVPSHHSKLPLELVLAILNSKLAEWYFRLGSTNAMVSEYQFNILPCPIFTDKKSKSDRDLFAAAKSALDQQDFPKVLALLEPACQSAPFPLAIQDIIIAAVERIIAIEQNRGQISRSDRSQLAPTAQPYQNLIDHLFYRMADLTPEESTALESRLAKML